MPRHVVCRTDALRPGEVKIVTVGRLSVGVYNVNGQFYALRNVCPHRGAPLCRGDVSGTMLPSEPGNYRYGRANMIVSCPWHRWQFDISTGKSILEHGKTQVKTYPVYVEDEHLEVEL